MLNGRLEEHDNQFTSVSVKGLSVIDCCITHQGQFSKFSDFKVISTTQMVVGSGVASVYTPSCIPDHSLLSWKVNMKVTDTDVGTMGHESSDKFDLKHVWK